MLDCATQQWVLCLPQRASVALRDAGVMLTRSPRSFSLLQGAKADAGLPADLASFKPPILGAAIEVRLCAEDPAHGFRPATGELRSPTLLLPAWLAQAHTLHPAPGGCLSHPPSAHPPPVLPPPCTFPHPHPNPELSSPQVCWGR